MDDDWRLTNQMRFLFQATLKRSLFTRTSINDHEHCEFCFDKFGEGAERLKFGYCTLDGYHWICEKCFSDFQKQFQWKLQKGENEE